MKRIIVVGLFFAGLLLSCEETIKLDLDQVQQQIIIEGVVTNNPNHQFIKVTRTLGFYQSGRPTPVTNATIVLHDNTGQSYPFSHNPTANNGQDGYYFPTAGFAGATGRTYRLEVQADNQIYEATDVLYPVTTFDSITYRLNEDQVEEPEEEGKFYELLMYAKEPQESKDYYLFKFYRNDTLITFFDTDIYSTDDILLGERIDGLPSPVYFGELDTARIEMLSLSRNGYLFYNDLFNLINNDGGMFGSPPANPRTNLTNGALGFFQASAIESDTLIIIKN
jgi:hypothetical protein